MVFNDRNSENLPYRQRFFSFLLIAFSLTWVGCAGAQNFRGIISTQGLHDLQEMKDQPIQIEMKYDALNWEATAKVQNDQGQELLKPIQIKKVNSHHYDLVIPNVRWRTIHMEQLKDDPTCFLGLNLYRTKFCHGDFSFNLTVEDKSTQEIKMRIFGAVSMPPPSFTESTSGGGSNLDEGVGHTFTVPEAIDRMFKRNFDIQEGRQELVRAQENATRNYLNLLPHPTLGSAIVAELALSGPTTQMTKSLGDIVPFLLPARWMTAKESEWEYKAQKVTYEIKKANAILALQIHAILFEAHSDLLDELSALMTEVESSLEIARGLHHDGYIEESSVLTIESSINDLKKKSQKVGAEFGFDQFELSKLLGFRKAKAVKKVLLGKETLHAKEISVLNAEEFATELDNNIGLAEAGSFELPQLYFLWKAASLKSTSVYLNWFDVSGRDGFGLNLFPDKAIARSVINSLEISQKTIYSTLNFKVSKHLLKRNNLKQYWVESEKALENRRKIMALRFEGILHFVENLKKEGSEKTNVSASAIRGAVKDTMNGLEDYYTLRAEVEIQQAELDHMLLKRAYEGFVPQGKDSYFQISPPQ